MNVPSTTLLKLAVGLLLGLAAAGNARGAAPGPPSSFETELLAPGVQLFRPPASREDLTNSVVVDRSDGLLVIEAQPTPEAGRELLAAIGRWSPKPIRYLVLSHPHAESMGGATAFPSSTLVIACAGFRDTLANPDFDSGAEMRARSGATYVPPPTPQAVLVIYSRTELADADHPVELLPLPPAHTAGDLVVHIVKAQMVYVGALLSSDRNPFPRDADLEGWGAALQNVIRMAPTAAIPLRGRSVNVRTVRGQRDALAWLRGQVEAALHRDEAPAEIPARLIAAPEFSANFDPKATPSFAVQLIEHAVADALEARRKRGLP